MADFTIEQLKAMKEGTTPGPWITHARSFGQIESIGPIEPEFSGNGLECTEEDAGLATAAPALVDALIAEKRARQKLRAEIEAVLDVVKHEMWLHDDEGQFPEAVQLGSYVTAQLARILEATDE